MLRGVDFEVVPASIFALLGANGAGKTTVVKILSTLVKADTGTVRVNGFDVATHPAKVRASISLTGQFADRGGHPEGGDLFGGHAPASRPRDEPHRQFAGHRPGRANDRA